MNLFPLALSPRAALRCAVAGWLVGWGAVAAAQAIDSDPTRAVILPPRIVLASPEARQPLVVQWADGERLLAQADEPIQWLSSDEQVVRVAGGVAIPVGDGQATLTAKVRGQVAQAAVEVRGQAEPFQWSFRNHVEAVLSKTGCNGGACHGARAGKNGFRLTLFGYDLDADYDYLTRHARGRRIVFEDPGRSLLLTKPTGLLPHKGGVRLEPSSLEYRVLAEWIAGGAPRHRDDDPVIERLEVLPGASVQRLDAQQQLLVQAHFSDGHVEDVTRWAKYTSADDSVATVDGGGRVTITGPGETAIVVWYLNRTELAYLRAAYPAPVDPAVFAAAPRRNFVDGLVLDKLRELNLPPTPRCDDATFLRRAHFDTIGVPPTTDEVRRFVADPAPDKRDRLIDDLLARPEFVDYWSYRWSDLLLVSGERLRPKAVDAYYGWIRRQVAENTPWDEFVRRIVTASGSTFENGAANFYALHQDPTVMAETVSQAFLGLSINCAQCHNHPLEKWTNDQYYGMANMFARVRGKGWGGDFRNGEGERIIYSDTQGELLQPATGRPQPPRPLDGETIPFDALLDRREPLARWLTAPDNPYFTRAIVNRVWANFFHVGIVEAVDDLRATNPPSNRELLDELSGFLIAQRYDLKELMRVILQSETYQRASQPLAENEGDTRYYSRYYPRRLPAEVLLDAISQATGAPTKFGDLPLGTRALELRDAATPSYFLATFGRPERLITCACERTDEPSMTQVLHLLNGETVNQKLKSGEGAIARLLAEGATSAAIVDEAYLAALGRVATDAEREQLVALLDETPAEERRQAVEDLFWSLLSSREFLFNH